MRRPIVIVSLLSSALLLSSMVLAETTIREEVNEGAGPLVRNPIRYDRFCVRSAWQTENEFVGGTQDWTGVGRETKTGGEYVDDQARWATMISTSWFTTAWHFRPRAANEIQFNYGNDPYVGESHGVETTHALFDVATHSGTRDGCVGQLETQTSALVPSYPILIMSDYTLQPTIMFGITGTDDRIPTRQKLGTSTTVSSTLLDVGPGFYGGLASFWYVPPLVPGTGTELMATLPRTYDSGAPTFTLESWQPILLGTHWTGRSGTAGDPLARIVFNGMWDNLLGAYRDSIVAKMDEVQADAGIPISQRERAVFMRMSSTGSVNFLDYTGDFRIDDDDITLLTRAYHNYRTGVWTGYNWGLDPDRDGDVDWYDVEFWLQAYGSQIGDANLDHRVDELDLLIIELNMGMLDGAEWQDGDFTGDGMVTYIDHVAWLIYQGWSAF